MDNRNLRGQRKWTILGVPVTKKNFDKICERLNDFMMKFLIIAAVGVVAGVFFKGMSDATKITGGFWHWVWWLFSFLGFATGIILFICFFVLFIRKAKFGFSRFVGELREDDDPPARSEFTARHDDDSSYDDFWDTDSQSEGNGDDPDSWDSIINS